MNSRPNILAVIPARGGSKRLPGKNIRPLAGLPLIAWTIRCALQSGAFGRVLVSTDDEEIARVAREHGADVPWLRPPELSTDEAGSADVVLHALKQTEDETGKDWPCLALLQPTSPFRTPATVRAGVELFLAGDGPVLGMSPARTHPELCFELNAAGRLQAYCSVSKAVSLRSQDLPPALEINGALYICASEQLRRERTFLGSQARPLVMQDPVEALDIDDAWDWEIACCAANSRKPAHNTQEAS